MSIFGDFLLACEFISIHNRCERFTSGEEKSGNEQLTEEVRQKPKKKNHLL